MEILWNEIISNPVILAAVIAGLAGLGWNSHARKRRERREDFERAMRLAQKH